MAELEEIGEFAEEVEGCLEETGEGLDAEEEEKLEDEVEESKENAGKMKKVIESLKKIDTVAVLRKFTVFVAEQAAIAVVFYGVNVVLKKMFEEGKKRGGDNKANQQKLAKTKALSALISDVSNTSKTLTEWLKDHQSDTITIGDDIIVPLTDIFFKYTKEMAKVRTCKY